MNEKFKAITSQLDYIADRVVIATGPFQKPFIPELPGALSERIFQMHSSEYRRPSQLPKGSILVIGAGNSGVQIAAELTESRRVYLSTGHDLTFLPQNLLNRSIFWWLDKTRLSRVSSDSKLARFLQKTEPIIGTELKSLVNSEKVHIKERTVSFHDQKAVFKDGLETEVDSIIWATGFQFDFSWIQIPGVLDQKGKPIHRRGISPVTGIYFLGLPWLSRSGSAQLNGIGHDAKYLWEYLS